MENTMNNVARQVVSPVSRQSIASNPPFLRQSNFGIPTLKRNLRPFPKVEIINDLARKLPLDLHFALQEISFQNGQTIYDFDDTVNFVYFPQNCVAMRLNLLEDGSMVEVGITGKEGILGSAALFGNPLSQDLLVAEIGGQALQIRADVLREFFRRSEDFQNEIFGFQQNFLMQISQRSACRCRHNVAAQLSTWLLLLSERLNGAEIPLTHETIARRLGARRAGITVAVNDLEDAHAIKCGRGKIIVQNRRILENHACECYKVLSNKS